MISDLNAVPPDILDEARRLGGEERYQFLWERATPLNRAFLRLFIRDVVEGDVDAASWGFGKVLLPDLSLTTLLASSAAEVVASLGRPGDEGWFRVATDFPEELSDRYVGAPAVLRRDLKYLWRPPRGVTAKTLQMVPRLRPLTDVEPAVRRWMAYRAGMTAGFRWDLFTDPATVAEILGVDPDALSADGARALEALVAEAKMDSSAQVPPGFRGPDSLYA